MARNKRMFLVLIMVVASTLACSFPGLSDSNARLGDGFTENYFPSTDGLSVNSFQYSQEQQSVISSYGNPTRFVIFFMKTMKDSWPQTTSRYRGGRAERRREEARQCIRASC